MHAAFMHIISYIILQCYVGDELVDLVHIRYSEQPQWGLDMPCVKIRLYLFHNLILIQGSSHSCIHDTNTKFET